LKLRNYQEGDELQIVELLNLAYGHWGSVEHWKQKYMHSKGFDPELIFLAEEDGRVISCVQYLRRDLKLGDRTISSYVGGDGATHPKYVGEGIFSKLLSMLYGEVRRRKGGCVYGYNNQIIYEIFYREKFGEVALHRSQVMIKILNINALAMSILPVANVMMRKWLSIGGGQTFTVRLDLTGQASLDYCIRDNKIKKCKIRARPDIKIKTRIEVLIKIILDNYSPLKALLLREIVVSISPGVLIRTLANPRALILAVKTRLGA